MRSDHEEMPEGFTKDQADRAEIAEANDLKLRSMQRGANALAAPTDCMRYWPQEQYLVCGEIRVKYDSLGGSVSFLGPPSSNDVANPDNYGRRQTFWNGPIYWSPASGAHPVANHFFAAWQRNGWEGGVLKYPMRWPTFCRCPPDSSPARWSCRPFSPTLAATSASRSSTTEGDSL
jgi:uncharacterized protein with LGFP repeats